MRTHLALLRGINVGGRNRLAMADLREVVTSLGHRDVATYIQSGNVVFSSDEEDTRTLAAGLERALVERTDVRTGVVVVTREALAGVVAADPYPQEPDPTHVHVVFHGEPIDPDVAADVAAAEQRARDKGSPDRATVVGTVAGTVVYLHTPDGLGRSELAVQLARQPRGAAPSVTTTRNRATVTRLLAMLDEGSADPG